MRLTSALASFLTSLAVTSASPFHIYLPESTPSSQLDISPELAKLIIARRLSLEDSYTLSNLQDPVKSIGLLDQYGGPKPQPFKLNHHEDKTHILFVIENVSDPKYLGYESSLSVNSAPSSRSVEELVKEFSQTSRDVRVPGTPQQEPLSKVKALAERPGNSISNGNDRIVVYVKNSGNFDKDEEISNIKAAINQVSESSDFVTTVLFMPGDILDSSYTSSYWGAKIQKRQTPSLSYVGQSKASSNQVLQNIPFKFPTKLECQETTKNCTGHGTCIRSFNKPDGNNHNIEHWKCKCSASTSKSDKSVQYWGGNACQKMDISSPFWLLTGTTIGIAFTIIMAINMLASMGSQELPSVIGAGVTGPKPK